MFIVPCSLFKETFFIVLFLEHAVIILSLKAVLVLLSHMYYVVWKVPIFLSIAFVYYLLTSGCLQFETIIEPNIFSGFSITAVWKQDVQTCNIYAKRLSLAHDNVKRSEERPHINTCRVINVYENINIVKLTEESYHQSWSNYQHFRRCERFCISLKTGIQTKKRTMRVL